MAATLKPDVAEKIDLLISAGMRRTKDIQAELARQGLKHIPGHNAIVRRRVLHDAVGVKGSGERVNVDAGGAAGPHPDEHVTFEESGDSGKLSCVTREEVQSEEDLVRVCKIDLTRWRVVRMKVKAYQCAMKIGVREADDRGRPRVIRETPLTVQLFSVSADLERVLPKVYMDATESLFERLSLGVPAYAAPPRNNSPYIATIGLFDVHFAKLCWGLETGHGDFDLRIAELVYRHAVEDLLRKLEPYPIGRFKVPIGQDIFHIDTAKNTTTGGTVVDTDGRHPKMIEVGSAAVIWMFDLLQQVAPADGLYVPGNHDRLSSYHLAREVKAWFRNAPGISVDTSPNTRKYVRHGGCLFGYRHGDNVSEAQVPTLPGLMADEAPKEWGQTTCRAWFLGHKHTSKRYTTRESDEIRGTRMHWLSALSGTDAWHHEMGFVGNAQAAEVYLHSEDEGYCGHFVAPARLN